MEPVLSQAQIDDLIKAIINSSYDFDKTSIIKKIEQSSENEREKTRNIFKNFSSILELQVQSFKEGLRKSLPLSKVDVELVHLEQIRLYEVLNGTADNDVLCIFKINNLKGRCILDIPNSFYQEIIRQNYMEPEYIEGDLSIKDLFYNILFRIGDVFETIYQNEDKKEILKKITEEMIICSDFYITDMNITYPRTINLPGEEAVIMSIFDITVDDLMFTMCLSIPFCMIDEGMDSLMSTELLTEWFYKDE